MGQVDFDGNEVLDLEPHLVMQKVRGTDWIIPEDYEGKPMTDKEIEFFKDYPYVKPFDQCKGCSEYFLDILRSCSSGRYYVEEALWSSKVGGPVCGGCREGEGDYSNTVIIYDPELKQATKYRVGIYFDEAWGGPENLAVDELELNPGDFSPDGWGEEQSPVQFKWHSTDAWRGYYNPVIPEGWRRVHEDCILSMSADERHLKNFDEEVKKALWDLGVKFAICFGRTSNVFSTGYDILAEISEDELKNMAVIMTLNALKLRHRDADRFARTALTGSSEDTKQARLLMKASRRLRAGEDFEDVKEDILAEMRSNA